MSTAIERASALWPDVAIVDIGMPVGQGLETIARLRYRVADLAVIATSRRRLTTQHERVARACGACRVVRNPERAKLRRAVRELLAARL
jgi:CheY-like chemotaxis protein